MTLTWFATASILIEAGGERLLFDPFIPLDGAEYPVTPAEYGKGNTIFITHGHLDHLGSVDLIVKNGDSRVFCTRTPADCLRTRLADPSVLTVIRPGDRIALKAAAVIVHPGRHIEYDGSLIRRTVFSSRNFRYLNNARRILQGRRIFRENNETVIFEVSSRGATVVLLGSMALAEGHTYPQEPDILVLPYQGNSDLITPALTIIEQLKPKAVLLDHFDDAFPPISRTIDTGRFEEAAARRYPNVKVIKPAPKRSIVV